MLHFGISICYLIAQILYLYLLTQQFVIASYHYYCSTQEQCDQPPEFIFYSRADASGVNTRRNRRSFRRINSNPYYILFARTRRIRSLSYFNVYKCFSIRPTNCRPRHAC
jgi:hypothetical protein